MLMLHALEGTLRIEYESQSYTESRRGIERERRERARDKFFEDVERNRHELKIFANSHWCMVETHENAKRTYYAHSSRQHA